MAVQVFEIKWEGFYTIEQAIQHRIARGKGIYIDCSLSGRSRKPSYIGKSREIQKRLKDHKQSITRFSPDKSKQATFVLGEIYDYNKDRVSADITPEQLGNIERFLIIKVPNNNPQKRLYKGNIVVVNTGKVASMLDRVIAHDTKVVDLITGSTSRKRNKKSEPKHDSLFYVGKI